MNDAKPLTAEELAEWQGWLSVRKSLNTSEPARFICVGDVRSFLATIAERDEAIRVLAKLSCNNFSASAWVVAQANPTAAAALAAAKEAR